MAIATFFAASTVTAGDAVYVSGSGFLYPAISSQLSQSAVIGVALDSALVGAMARVDTDGVYTAYDSLTPGVSFYLSATTSGSIVDYTTWRNQFNTTSLSGAYLTHVGTSVSSSGLSIETSRPLFVSSGTLNLG